MSDERYIKKSKQIALKILGQSNNCLDSQALFNAASTWRMANNEEGSHGTSVLANLPHTSNTRKTNFSQYMNFFRILLYKVSNYHIFIYHLVPLKN